MHNYFPSCINVSDRDCWVVGNDRDAVEKTGRLAEAGARVTVIAPDFTAEALGQFTAWNVKILQREFKLDDIDDQFFIVLSAKENAALAEKVFSLCRRKKILLCAIDQPRFCDVVNVSVFKKGHLTVLISTEGTAPGVSRKMRQGLEKSLESVPVEKFLDDLAELRVNLEKNEKNPDERRRKLLAAVEGFDFRGEVTFPASWSKKQKSK